MLSKDKAMTTYYWEILSRTAQLAINKMRELKKKKGRKYRLQWGYYDSIVVRCCRERGDALKKRRIGENIKNQN